MKKEYLQLVEKALEERQYPSDPKELYEPIRYILDLGGKRIRPILCLMAAELFDQDINSKRILEVALAIEIFHNFSLVHDDIMDEAPLRRGQPTVHQKWNRDTAILSGDVMLVQAYQALLLSNNVNLKKLIEQFNKSAILVCEGQQLDMNFESDDEVSLQSYIRMIGLKTAELLGCSLMMGAIASEASESDVLSLYEFGLNLGIAFQIQDDYLDAFGESEKVGKQPGGDILCNKKTFLLLRSKELASADQALKLEKAMQLDGKDKVDKVLSIYTELEIEAESKKAITKYFQKAMESLDSVKVSEEKKSDLTKLANDLLRRDH